MAEEWAKGRRAREALLEAAAELDDGAQTATAVAKVGKGPVFAMPGSKGHKAGAAKAPVKKAATKVLGLTLTLTLTRPPPPSPNPNPYSN
jgi:hypothetical protein